MSAPVHLSVATDTTIAPDLGEPVAAAEPQVFARSILTPAGAPWDQRRAADLDARRGAPRPIIELYYRLHRLEPWRPGPVGRYVALYVRRSDVLGRFVAETVVEGRPFTTVFEAAHYQDQRNRDLVLRASVIALTVVLALTGLVGALNLRAKREAELSALEQAADVDLRGALAVNERKRAALALDALGMRGHTASDFLADLAWASASKTPGAHFQALYWEPGLMAAEVRGPLAPFTAKDRDIHKTDRQLGPGLSLWGVKSNGANKAGADAPSAP